MAGGTRFRAVSAIFPQCIRPVPMRLSNQAGYNPASYVDFPRKHGFS